MYGDLIGDALKSVFFLGLAVGMFVTGIVALVLM